MGTQQTPSTSNQLFWTEQHGRKQQNWRKVSQQPHARYTIYRPHTTLQLESKQWATWKILDQISMWTNSRDTSRQRYTTDNRSDMPVRNIHEVSDWLPELQSLLVQLTGWHNKQLKLSKV